MDPPRRPPRRPPRKPRCPVCKLLDPGCVCSRFARVRTETRVVIIQHSRERKSQSNTGSLTHHVLLDSRLLIHGAPERRLDAAPCFDDPDLDYRLLFPLPSAEVIGPSPALQAGKRLALVVLDGTWSQARRMSYKISGLRSLPCLQLPPGALPRIRLRKPRKPGQLGTAEAIALALELLGEWDEAQTLREALAVQASSVLRARGKFPRPGSFSYNPPVPS